MPFTTNVQVRMKDIDARWRSAIDATNDNAMTKAEIRQTSADTKLVENSIPRGEIDRNRSPKGVVCGNLSHSTWTQSWVPPFNTTQVNRERKLEPFCTYRTILTRI